MNRRIFCKSAALSYFLLPFLSSKLFANTKGSGVFLGELIINGKKTNSQSIELGDAIVQSGAKQAVLVEITSSSDLAVDWECLNLCKQAVKGTFTIGELNQFCIMQCPIK